MVVKTYKLQNSTVEIVDDFLLKDREEINKVLEEVKKIYIRAFERGDTDEI